MVKIEIDEHSHKILKEVRDKLKEQGIRASLSDAIRELYKYWKERRGWNDRV